MQANLGKRDMHSELRLMIMIIIFGSKKLPLRPGGLSIWEKQKVKWIWYIKIEPVSWFPLHTNDGENQNGE